MTATALLAPVRTGRQTVNISVGVDYAEGGEYLINEGFQVTSEDALSAAADELRRMADLLDRAVREGMRP